MVKNNYMRSAFMAFWLMSILMVSCSKDKNTEQRTADNNTSSLVNKEIMEVLNPANTGVDFENTLEEDNSRNYYFDEYIYNGGGVAIGDINNDGLEDIFFTGNQVANRLYLNKGNMQFEDISESAEIDKGGWSNGVTMVDINADGYLDIYVCRGGSLEKDIPMRQNLLFINNKNNTFTEKAKEYGIADPSLSLNSVFFDYDLDGDLDLYVSNYPTEFKLTVEESNKKSANPGRFETDRLYKNNGNNTFSNVGKTSGIFNYGHGLGLGVGDFNFDGYPDIYVANDFVTDDYFYMNNGDGSFTNRIKNTTKHTSQFSMGCDIADINNDMLLDIFVADMSAEDNFRSKAMMPSMNPDAFWHAVQSGLHYQYMRNVLQVNVGASNFSEIGQLAGISKTDWSWAPLFVDFDNDGWKDIYVTNGYLRDLDEKDANKRALKKQKEKNRNLLWEEVVEVFSSTKLENYIFRNNTDLTFSKQNGVWLNQAASFSNGAAYGDLDNDGDMDLVINNLNDKAFVIKNKSRDLGSNYIQIKLEGTQMNRDGIGAKILIRTSEGNQYQELYSSRGYLSSSQNVAHFGLGNDEVVSDIWVKWFNGKESYYQNVQGNQRILLRFQDAAQANNLRPPTPKNLFFDVNQYTGLTKVHRENNYDDYKNQVLLPHKMSQYGPSIAKGDVNGDGFDDIYVGAAANSPSTLYIQTGDLRFTEMPTEDFVKDAGYEDTGATFLDAEGDGDLDLYVVSGGFERPEGDSYYQDRLYLNDGRGNFARSLSALPKVNSSGACAVPIDIDRDGLMDLFVGGKVVPDKYPYAPDSYILKNNNGKFTDVTDQVAPDLRKVGMVSRAIKDDIDKDGNEELIVVGEWMDVKIFSVSNGTLVDNTSKFGTDNTTGWWFSVQKADLDGDGDNDFIAGNLGLNYKYQASTSEPFKIYCDDFDKNGTYDIVLSYYYDDTEYPLRGLQCSSEQMPFVKDKFPTYNEFASADINDVYGKDLDNALHYAVSDFASAIFWNDNGKLVRQNLPNEVQVSPIFGIVVDDFNRDGIQDIASVGNLMVSEVETGNADAGFGSVLFGQGNRSFSYMAPVEAGLVAPFDSRNMIKITGSNRKNLLVIANNHGPLQSYGYDAAL